MRNEVGRGVRILLLAAVLPGVLVACPADEAGPPESTPCGPMECGEGQMCFVDVPFIEDETCDDEITYHCMDIPEACGGSAADCECSGCLDSASCSCDDLDLNVVRCECADCI